MNREERGTKTIEVSLGNWKCIQQLKLKWDQNSANEVISELLDGAE
jgi:hypothetical protein